MYLQIICCLASYPFLPINGQIWGVVPKNTMMDVGEDFEFACDPYKEFTYINDAYWYGMGVVNDNREGHQITNKRGIVQDYKYPVRYENLESPENVTNFKIKGVELGDAGRYECWIVLQNNSRVIRYSMQLYVKVADTPTQPSPDCEYRINGTMTVGDILQVTCIFLSNGSSMAAMKVQTHKSTYDVTTSGALYSGRATFTCDIVLHRELDEMTLNTTVYQPVEDLGVSTVLENFFYVKVEIPEYHFREFTYLNVTYGPSKVEFSPPGMLYYRDILICKANGNPEPVLSLNVNGIPQEENAFVIGPRVNGKLVAYCNATNVVNGKVKYKVRKQVFIVHNKPKFKTHLQTLAGGRLKPVYRVIILLAALACSSTYR